MSTENLPSECKPLTLDPHPKDAEGKQRLRDALQNYMKECAEYVGPFTASNNGNRITFEHFYDKHASMVLDCGSTRVIVADRCVATQVREDLRLTVENADLNYAVHALPKLCHTITKSRESYKEKAYKNPTCKARSMEARAF